VSPLLDVVEFTDPVCSYAWGTEPKRRRLQWQYGHLLRWRRVMVAMHAPGWSDWTGRALDDPVLAQHVSDYWRGVSELTGMPYPDPLHHVHVSSEDMARLVKAAELQGEQVAEDLLRRIRESVFVAGRPADTLERGLALAAEVAGLDVARLARDVVSPGVEQAYAADWEEARNPNGFVRAIPDERPGYGRAQPAGDRLRYGIPCMILTGRDEAAGGPVTVAGWQGWDGWAAALERAAPGIAAYARPLPTRAEALRRWPTLTAPELAELGL
jgi:protein-disulfide isomerase-like protein with CxxC motif